jgi:3-deoxy-D-manno-octulosonic-acid transferase
MIIYQLLIRVLSPLIWLLILGETIQRQAGKRFFLQRLGLAYPTLPNASKRLWFHCASVGEIKAAEPLIRALQKHQEILITTNTPTGKQFAESLFSDSVEQRYLPLDWPYAINRFLAACKPTQLYVLETEIWPNLYRICHQQGIELCILNARMSRKTLSAPKWLKDAYRQSLAHVTQILARSPIEADRFVIMGAPISKVITAGNLKYAQVTEVTHHKNPIGREYVLLASSHADEELAISQLWLQQRRPELLVIVPRHPKRSETIQKQLLPLCKTLKVASKGDQPTSETQLFLDDRLGKLLPLYEHANLVIMGGSFAPKGGHNVIEPAIYQRPIITGPDMRDFEDETALLKTYQGITQCQDYGQLESVIAELIDNPKQRLILGEGANKAVQSQTAILKIYLEHIQ